MTFLLQKTGNSFAGSFPILHRKSRRFGRKEIFDFMGKGNPQKQGLPFLLYSSAFPVTNPVTKTIAYMLFSFGKQHYSGLLSKKSHLPGKTKTPFFFFLDHISLFRISVQ